jgi:hypothetical protein
VHAVAADACCCQMSICDFRRVEFFIGEVSSDAACDIHLRSCFVFLQISVRWLTAEAGKHIREPRTMHFKLSDRNVTLCPLGMSSAVL